MAKRILVVEDNDLNRKLFCDVLRSQGYGVEPVADGLEALARARDFVPNLIIMDIQLPNVSGLELIEGPRPIRSCAASRCWRSPPMPARATRSGSAMPGPRVIWPSLCRSGPFMAAVRAGRTALCLTLRGERLGGPNCAAFLPPRGWPLPYRSPIHGPRRHCRKDRRVDRPFNKKDVAITDATSFAGDLEFDSLTVMDFVAAIEDEFDIIISMNAQAEIETYGQLVDAVVKLQG
jgi:two-component system cell cycle response regulator DivK